MKSRKSVSRESIVSPVEGFEIDEEKKKYSPQTVPYYVGILFIFFLFLQLTLVRFICNQLPIGLKHGDEIAHPDRFIATRAQEDLKYLTDLGPRVVGSYENEVLAVEFLKRRIKEIMNESHENQQIELDVQLVSGSFTVESKGTAKISVYANLQNIVVKLHGKDSNNSLLLNAHFDTVPTSPGGSDDGINCVALLEILRKFSKRKTRPLYSVVFLFNGAEETGLQASHGFITKHKWAKECKVIINLDAAGAGGKITMFQTGPNRPWLNEDYGKVPHPSAKVTAEELFQNNFIPSDTDFRIFRDFGKLVGIDMAITKDGYRYHTKYDGFDNIPLGSYQQIGDNVMSLIENIANNVEITNENPKTGNMVFFDVLGGFFISYTTRTAFILNLIIFGISLMTFVLSLRRFKIGISINAWFYFMQILAMTLFGWILAFFTALLIAWGLDFIGYGMSWYGNPWLVLGLFVIPAIITSTPMLLLIKPMRLSQNANCFIQAQMIRLIWTTVMLLTTLLGIRSGYLFLVVVLFDTITYLLVLLLNMENSVWKWKITYIIISTIPTSYTMSTGLDLMSFFIPISGRNGSSKIPDIVIGFAAVFITLLSLTPYYFMISTLSKPKNFYKILTGLFVLCFFIVFTPLGFPYSGDKTSPTPQRYWILHSQRAFHGEDGEVIKKDSGYFFINMDRNSPRSVAPYVKELAKASNIEEDCNNFLLCGLPLPHPKMDASIKQSTWIPATAPVIPDPVNIKVHSKTAISPTIIRYNLTIFAPDHTIFHISPKKNMKVSNISLLDQTNINGMLWNGRSFHFFVYICGKKLEPLNFSFDISVAENHTGPAIDIAVAGSYVHTKKIKFSQDFITFLSQFPDWADLTVWIGNYQTWVI